MIAAPETGRRFYCKKYEKSKKRCLTNGAFSLIIPTNTGAAQGQRDPLEKEFFKKMKKVLDKCGSLCYYVKVRYGERLYLVN